MASDRTGTPTDQLDPPGGPEVETGRYITPVKVILAVIMVAILAMWIYAFSGLAKQPSPDALRDTSLGPKAEAICAPVAQQLAALPNADQTPSPAQRAETVERSNQLLSSMVDQLAALPIGGTAEDQPRDQTIYDQWVADWRTYIGDRADYARRLRTDRDARIFVTQKGAKQITEPLGGFATANAMGSCKPPADIF